MENGIVIYGIIEMNASLEAEIENVNRPGIPTVSPIKVKDIAAVISHKPAVTYNTLSTEQVMKDLAVHQAVLEKVMEKFTVIPVKFGTMLESEDEVITLLEKGYMLLHNLLQERAGKIELDIVAWWETQEILPVISRQNKQVREKQQEIAQKGDTVSQQDKVVLGQYIEQALQVEKERCQHLILQALQQEAEDVCTHSLADDQMVFNAAFLLARDHEAAFYQAIDALDESLQGRLYFRIVGPLPTYSFSTIQIHKIDPDRVKTAREILGLPTKITTKTVHAAYHKRAKEIHPDKQGAREDSKEFQRIHEAYLTLKSFTENGAIFPELYQYRQ